MNIVQNESQWIRCPICDGKTRNKVYADTEMFNFPLCCPKCKKEIRVDIMQLKIAISIGRSIGLLRNEK
uniref:cysteine-rich KTR domain-containing protein n=1 Tax=Faecousia sp. TaxID=2952921 RepID=UPI004028C71B